MSVRVCHLTTVHAPLDIRIARKELATLAAAGYEAWLVAHADDRQIGQLKVLDINVKALRRGSGGSRARRMTGTALAAFQAARSVDAAIYQFHDPELIPVGLALKAAGRKVVMDVHEDLSAQMSMKAWMPKPLRSPVARISRYLETAGAKRFDAVVAATPKIAALFKASARKCVEINNYPILDELVSQSDGGNWHARRRVAYIGTISFERGIRELVEAIALSDATLTLAGSYMRAWEHDEIVALGGWSHVDERGEVDRKQLGALLQDSFVGICTLYPTPNHLESHPIKLFEYMAAGIPVIASDFPLWRRIVVDNNAGLCVDPKSPASVAQAIRYLRDHPDVAERMGQNGRRAVVERYNWEAEGTRLIDLYRALSTPR